jgi:protein O-mannosyl-transferase
MKRPATIATVTALILMNLLVFGQVAWFDFVHYDDMIYVYENPAVQAGLSRAGVDWALRPQIGLWHPLTWLSLMLDVQLFGMRPGAHHIVNLLLHMLNTVLLFWVLRRMTGAHWPSALVAVLFAIHPLHVEPVVWISSRKDVLSTLFLMLTLWAYDAFAARRTFLRYMLVVASLFFGLMAKSMLVTLPFVLLLLDYWPLRRIDDVSGRRDAVRRWGLVALEKVPLFAISVFFCIMTYIAGKQGNTISSISSTSVPTRIENTLVNYATYLVKTVWPSGLAPHYPHLGDTIALAKVAAALVLLLAVTGVALWARRRSPSVLVGWLWFLGTLVPVIGLVPVGAHVAADRYTYVPLIGVFIMLAFGAADLAAHWCVTKRVLTGTCACALVALMVCAGLQARHWRDSMALWTNTVRVNPDNALAHNNLGYEWLTQGFLGRAKAAYRRAIEVEPYFAQGHNNLGNVLMMQGRHDEGIASFQRALQCDPNLVAAQVNLVRALSSATSNPRTASALAEAVKHDPLNPAKHFELGRALTREGRENEAMETFAEVIRLDPDHVEARTRLGNALLDESRFGEAAEQFEEIVRRMPDDPDARTNLGLALHAQGKLQEAMDQFTTALRLGPGHDAAQHALAQTQEALSNR